MKIIFITNISDGKSGWGRYSNDLLSSLRYAGVEVAVLDILPNPLLFKRIIFLTPWYLVKAFLRWREIRKADCIHCLIEPYAFFALVLSLIFRKKYFITVHGSYAVKTLKSDFLRPFQKMSYKNASTIISISHFTRDQLGKFIQLPNIVIIPNGGPSKTYTGSLDKIPNSFISVGALKWRKGHHKVVEILALLKKEIPDVNLTIVGNQDDKIYVENLKKKIFDLGLLENVKLLFNLSDEDLDKAYKKSKIFILTPLSGEVDFEGFGLVYLEANSRGLPTVGSINSGAAEAIIDGQSGFLVDPDDYKSATLLLKRILTEAGLYANMSKGALSWAASMTWTKQVPKYIKIYKNK